MTNRKDTDQNERIEKAPSSALSEAQTLSDRTDHHMDRLATAFESSAHRWELIVYPTLFAFILLAVYGFFLIYSLTRDISTMSNNITQMTTVISEMSSDMGNLTLMRTSMENMSTDVHSMALSTDGMYRDINVMSRQMGSMNNNVGRMSSMMPW